MSTEYKIRIHRKHDDKLLGVVMCNYLKTIFESEFSDKVGGEGYSRDGRRFTPDDLTTVRNLAETKTETLHGDVMNKTMMIALAKDVNIKSELEYDIRCIKDEIRECTNVICSSSTVYGMILCVVEDLFRNDTPAYEYNGEDLPPKTGKYNDGTAFTCTPSVWVNDVYCVIEIC